MKASAILSTITQTPPFSASPSPPDRFALTGTSWTYDPRIHAARKDIADVALAGRLFAPHYARALPFVCARTPLPLLDRPDGRQASELLAGEGFAVLDIGAGWAWGYCLHDHRVGYVRIDGLAPAETAVPPEPPVAGGDPASVAERFAGTPYRPGGRSEAGMDAAGLVQRALAPFGIAAPRESDLQRDQLGEALPRAEAPARNDLVFLAEHVGIMIDGERLVHACSRAEAVVVEPLAVCTAGTDAASTVVKRLSL